MPLSPEDLERWTRIAHDRSTPRFAQYAANLVARHHAADYLGLPAAKGIETKGGFEQREERVGGHCQGAIGKFGEGRNPKLVIASEARQYPAIDVAQGIEPEISSSLRSRRRQCSSLRQHRPFGHSRRGLAFRHHDMVGAAAHQIVDLFGTGFPDWETGSVLALFLIGVVAVLTAVFSRFLQPQRVAAE